MEEAMLTQPRQDPVSLLRGLGRSVHPIYGCLSKTTKELDKRSEKTRIHVSFCMHV